MACEGKSKFLHFVSTIGVFALQHAAEVIAEDTTPHKDRYKQVQTLLQVSMSYNMICIIASILMFTIS